MGSENWIGSEVFSASDLTKNIIWITATLTFDLQTGATNLMRRQLCPLT
jgi:hypothetical protein